MPTPHELKIDRLIPMAETLGEQTRIALGLPKTERREGTDGKPMIFCNRTLYFHKAMNQLCFDAGLRGWK